MHNNGSAAAIFPKSPPHAVESSSAQLDWRAGQTVGDGRFRLELPLGTGSTAAVLKAIDCATGETVAVKLPVARHAKLREQVQGEFQALGRVCHPNIVARRTLFAEEEVPFFTMECVDGEPFDAWVRPEGVLDVERLREALLQIAHAIGALHSEGMTHCDLKPSNVRVTADGRTVLLDFGLVTYAPETDACEPIDAEVYGTP